MVSRMREMWPGNSDDQNELINLVQRNQRLSMVRKIKTLSQTLLTDKILTIFSCNKTTLTEQI